MDDESGESTPQDCVTGVRRRGPEERVGWGWQSETGRWIKPNSITLSS